MVSPEFVDEKLARLGIEPLFGEYAPLSLDEVGELERRLGAFPPAYREVVMKYGGAVFNREVCFRPVDPRILVIAPDGLLTLDCIYGAAQGNDPWDPNSLRANIEWTNGRMPSTMIPVAGSGSDYVCLGLSAPDRGRVFYWERESEPTVNYNNVYLIAQSFGEFLGQLKCSND